MGPENAQVISNYVDLKDYFEEENLKFLRPDSYNMMSDKSRDLFTDVSINILIRDENQSAIEILGQVLNIRFRSIDSYLQNSNQLWRDYKYKIKSHLQNNG